MIKRTVSCILAALMLFMTGCTVRQPNSEEESGTAALSEQYIVSAAENETAENTELEALSEQQTEASSSEASTRPAATEPEKSTEMTKPVTTDPQTSKAQSILESMTLNEKIAQLFIVCPEALSSGQTACTAVSDKLKASLSKYPVGGVVLFAANIKNPSQLKSFTADLQESSSLPLFIGVDEEGGTVSRIASNESFNIEKIPAMETVGQTANTKNAYDVGRKIGKYLSEYGFNLDFAPVADVNTNEENRVIGSRAFGSDPELCAKMVSAEIDGFHSRGVMTCIKHFPGHGDTVGDTHLGYVAAMKTLDEMKKCELIPFKSNLKKTDMVMAAHITVPNVTSDGLPCSLSKYMIDGILRSELGYNGVVITDSLSMGAITAKYNSAQSAVMALTAGADIVLMPKNFEQAYNGVLDAVKSGKLTESRIDKSVLRVLELKEKYGLI